MKVGDLVKRRGQPWYAVILGFKTELEALPSEDGPYRLPKDDRRFPIFMWVKLDDKWPDDLWDVQSCSATLLEVVSHADLPL